MSSERVFNIFVYFDENVASQYGVRHHSVSGDDQDKLAYLLARIDQDHSLARRFNFPRTFTAKEWLTVHRLGKVLDYFEEAFTLFRGKPAPLYCLTPVVDGKPTVDRQIDPAPFRGDTVTKEDGLGAVPDYLVNYTDGNLFRFSELIHDDYFLAIKALFNAKLYVSCSKLLMSCVDTLAFVEYGDVPGNFGKWADTYLDLTPHGVSAEELWEFRNSVLHMTNLASRKVVAAKVSPIMPYVGGPEFRRPTSPNAPKPFNLYGLIKTVGNGIGKWAETYNADRDKILKFIERYDTTISDSRMTWVSAKDVS